MENELRAFVEKIQNINPQYVDFLGRGLPGMAGTSITTQGASTPGTDIINQLHTESIQFARLCSSHADRQKIDESARSVEGHLLALQTIGQLSKSDTDVLIDELHRLNA